MGTCECNPRTGETETRGSLRFVGQFSRLYEVSLMNGPVSETKRMVDFWALHGCAHICMCTCTHMCPHTETIKIRCPVIARVLLSE